MREMDGSIMCDCLKGEEKLVIPGDVVDESKPYVSSCYLFHQCLSLACGAASKIFVFNTNAYLISRIFRKYS